MHIRTGWTWFWSLLLVTYGSFFSIARPWKILLRPYMRTKDCVTLRGQLSSANCKCDTPLLAIHIFTWWTKVDSRVAYSRPLPSEPILRPHWQASTETQQTVYFSATCKPRGCWDSLAFPTSFQPQSTELWRTILEGVCYRGSDLDLSSALFGYVLDLATTTVQIWSLPAPFPAIHHSAQLLSTCHIVLDASNLSLNFVEPLPSSPVWFEKELDSLRLVDVCLISGFWRRFILSFVLVFAT